MRKFKENKLIYMEIKDRYFNKRQEIAKGHKVLKRINFDWQNIADTEPNKELPNPLTYETVDALSYNKNAVDAFIDAVKKGYIRVRLENNNMVAIEFIPIKELPEELGHVTEKKVLKSNLLNSADVFGDEDEANYTYLQSTDFAVEGYMSDEEEGKEYIRLYVDSSKLYNKRNIYLDPESLNVTEYEYGHSFIVFGGIPKHAISRAETIKAEKYNWVSDTDEYDYPSPEEVEKEMQEQRERLLSFLRENNL